MSISKELIAQIMEHCSHDKTSKNHVCALDGISLLLEGLGYQKLQCHVWDTPYEFMTKEVPKAQTI